MPVLVATAVAARGLDIKVVFQMIQSEVLVPVKLVWEVYSQASADQKCAAKFLCHVNEGAKKDGQTRQSVIRAASLAASWTLSKASIGTWTNSKSSQDNYWKLHHAVEAGYKGADCSASYPDKSCTLTRNIGQTEHNEL